MTFWRQVRESYGDTRWFCAAAAVLSVLAITAAPARGQCEAAKLTASDGEYNDRLGMWVDIAGDVAIAGAWYESEMGDYAGAAYVYRLDGERWVEEQKLVAENGEDHAYFGRGVGADGDRVIVGAPRHESHDYRTGAAYVFRYEAEAWSLEVQLNPPDPVDDHYFGQVVDIRGNVALVGAPGDSDHGDRSGAAYIYRHDGETWQFESKIVPADCVALDHFGEDVALGDGVALIGAEGDDDAASHAGAAYVYRYDGSTWIEEAKLLPSDGGEGDEFGLYLDIDGDVAVIGAEEHDGVANGSGAAYIYRRQGAEWIEEANLSASDGGTGDSFGDCAIQGDVAVVGAYSANGPAHNSGAAYLFRYDGASWAEQRKITASDGRLDDWFGRGVAMDGQRVLIGAHGDDDMAQTAGAAYVFELDGPDCNENGICDGRDILEGTSCDINANEIPDECEDLCTGDVNSDGGVDAEDLNELLGMWGPCPPEGACMADFICDDVINVADLLVLLGHWGPCPQRAAAPR